MSGRLTWEQLADDNGYYSHDGHGCDDEVEWWTEVREIESMREQMNYHTTTNKKIPTRTQF